MTKSLREISQALLDNWDTPEWNKLSKRAELMAELRAALADPTPVSSSGVTYTQAECDEMCEIAERNGYGKAVQEIDQKTGGDGEYRYCLGMEDSDRHTPDAPAMIQRIVDRFEILNLLDEATKTGSDQPDDSPLSSSVDLKALIAEFIKTHDERFHSAAGYNLRRDLAKLKELSK